jgi:hypothetical protein
MKRAIFPCLFFLLIGIWFLRISAKPPERFVSVSNGKFSLKEREFYPMILNYGIALRYDEKELWPAPSLSYDSSGNSRMDKKQSLATLAADMELIRSMGFNAVRIVGIGEARFDKEGKYAINVSKDDGNESPFFLEQEENYELYLQSLAILFDVIEKAGLKVIVLIHADPDNPEIENYLIQLAERFQHDETIMAYDLFNEPLYFDEPARKKEDVFKRTKHGKGIFKKHAPDQLVTIGLTGIREVFEWDPNAMNVDFISFHPYEYQNDQVRNEMYWYNRYVNKPWVIGETSLPADNDSVPYSEQKKFAEETIERTVNCNGIGYSWWQYKDVKWNEFHASYMGILNRQGETISQTGKEIKGTKKPVADVFTQKHNTVPNDSCNCLENYYNYNSLNKYCLFGKVLTNDNKPIEGAVIMAWDTTWTISYTTFSKADGSFELYSDIPMYHTIISATLFSALKSDVKPNRQEAEEKGSTRLEVKGNILWPVYF